MRTTSTRRRSAHPHLVCGPTVDALMIVISDKGHVACLFCAGYRECLVGGGITYLHVDVLFLNYCEC